jgi:hypothetical protein
MSAFDPKRTSACAGSRRYAAFMDARAAGSIRLDARELGHFAPFLGFFGDQFTEIAG